MKKSSVKYILCTLLVVCLITAEGIALYRHHQKASPQTATPVTTSGPGSRTDASETPLPETTPDPDSPEGKIYYAFEQILNEPSFHVDTDATINLKGRLIKGKRVLSAHAHVTGADDRDNLKLDMTTKTPSRGKTEKTRSTYHNGLYCSDNGKEKTKNERSPEEVLSMVTFISDIMHDASSQLENMKITSDDSDTIYSFTLPGETASYYFSRIIEQASMNTEELKHVTGSVDSLKMKCRLNKKGVLTEQYASASGTVSKSIFTIPVTLTETTSFMIP